MEHTRVLLVEDSSDDVDLLLRGLKKAALHHTVHRVRNGLEALQYLFGPHGQLLNRPDVVLLDLHMPLVGGIEVLRRVRSVEATKDLPVIAMLGTSGNRGEAPSLEAGANATIEKPVSISELTGIFDVLGVPWRKWQGDAPAA